MKKILHIQVLPKLSGAQKISLDIFRYLENDEYEKWILFSALLDVGDKEACRKAFEQTGAKILFSSRLRRSIGLYDLAATKEIYDLCRKEKFDIVHTHSSKPGIIGRIGATLAGVPLVVHTVHGLAFHKFVKFPKWQFYWVCEMFASLFCDRIVMVNRHYKGYFKWFGKKTYTIYNGIDFSHFPSVLKYEKGSARILFVGRLDSQKDPLTLLKAARLVIQECPESQFTLVGDGEKYEECVLFIEKYSLQKQIELKGWQNDVTPFYATHDIFAAPSIYESFGLMFLEAGYYGLPTVTTNVEGIPEVVEDGVTGLLCDPQDELSLARNIIRLINNKTERERLGENARERVKSRFTANNMVEQYRKIYEQHK